MELGISPHGSEAPSFAGASVFSILAAFLLVLSVSGCDTSASIFVDDVRRFSTFGYFDVREDEHYLRVSDFYDPIDSTVQDAVRPEIRLVDLAADTSEMLQPETLFARGRRVINYRLSGRLTFDNPYRLEIESEGFRAETEFRSPLAPPEVTSIDTLRLCLNGTVIASRPVDFVVEMEGDDRLVESRSVYFVDGTVYEFNSIIETLSQGGDRGRVEAQIATRNQLRTVFQQRNPFFSAPLDSIPIAVPDSFKLITSSSTTNGPAIEYVLAEGGLEERAQPGRFSNTDLQFGFVFATASDTTDGPYRREATRPCNF